MHHVFYLLASSSVSVSLRPPHQNRTRFFWAEPITYAQYYHPKRYFKVDRPNGIDYIGEVEIEEGKSIHGESRVRCEQYNASCSIRQRPPEWLICSPMSQSRTRRQGHLPLARHQAFQRRRGGLQNRRAAGMV